ncbi:MAG: hypothetical protein HY807_12075 [Nitrospirae bacterium]|nr:hypothetical protein [Nitrospirota bacterium]
MKTDHNDIETRGLLLRALKSFSRARRLQIICDFFNIGLALAIVLALIAIIHKMIFNTLLIPLQVFVICPVILFLISLFKPVKMKELALKIDGSLNLKERLTTSVDFLDKKDSYAALLFHDTLKELKGIKPQPLFPLKLNRTIPLSALLCGMLIFYSFYDFTKEESSKIYDLSPDVKSAVQKEGAQLKKLADTVETRSLAGEALDKEIIKKLESLGESLQAENIDRHDALLMLTDASESIKGLYLKEMGGAEDLSAADKEQVIAEEIIADGIEETINDILKSIESAKQHIAEADIEAIKKPLRETSDKGSYTKSLSTSEAASSVAGETEGTVSPGDISVSKKGSSREGRTSGSNDATYPAKDLEFPAENIILKYPDSVIPLGSLPKKYHKTVKDYFDAVSGG